MVPVELYKIIITETQEKQIIVLQEIGGERRFPIVIGTYEALAIQRRLKGGVKNSRPMTHDLLGSVIDKLGCKLVRIEIVDLHDATFFAQLVIQNGEQTVTVDSRPSDAIALGITGGVPIHVAAHVIEDATKG
jgi:uncharacterized protein